MVNESCIGRLRGNLIVSCQAFEGEPLFGPVFMSAMAECVVLGGAGGIRANGPADIAAIRKVTDLPIIGIWKRVYEGYEPYISPTLKDVLAVVEAGADIVAVDATSRVHPGGISAEDLIKSIKDRVNVPVMADVSTVEEGLCSESAGADLVATTLSGYTPYTRVCEDTGPPYKLLEELVRRLSIPVVAEGRIWGPKQACLALKKGAYAVTVGAAISRPHMITRRFVEVMQQCTPDDKIVDCNSHV
jgi:N-acylglucosamine-6-phosphate 2-epimerase